MERLSLFKKEERAKRRKKIEESGHHYVEENLRVVENLDASARRMQEKRLENSLKVSIAVQKRNARQFERVAGRILQTTEMKRAKKMRQSAMAEFILQQSMRKNSEGTKSWMTIITICRSSNHLILRLKEYRRIKHRNAQLKAMTAITIFVLHKFKAKRR